MDNIDDIRGIFEVRDKIENGFKNNKLKFSWNGHHKNGDYSSDVNQFYERNIAESAFLIVNHNYPKIKAVLENPGVNFVNFGTQKYNHGCEHCGQEIPLEFDGVTFRAKTVCPYPNGLGPIETEIITPTGQLVFANFFRGAERPKDDGYGYQSFKIETEHFGKLNIAYGACGNSCPGVWQNGNKIIIGNPGYDDDDKIVDGWPEFKRVGGVITDLWAWSAADVRTAMKYGWKQPEAGFKDGIVTVDPGKYKVTQLYHLNPERKYNHKRLFATLEKVGDL